MMKTGVAGDFAHAEGSRGRTAWAKADPAQRINRSFEAAFAHPTHSDAL